MQFPLFRREVCVASFILEPARLKIPRGLINLFPRVHDKGTTSRHRLIEWTPGDEQYLRVPGSSLNLDSIASTEHGQGSLGDDGAITLTDDGDLALHREDERVV